MTGCAALASGYLAVPATTALTAAALAAAFTAATLAAAIVTLAFLATAARAILKALSPTPLHYPLAAL